MSQRILFKDGLRVGKKELQLLQDSSLENVAEVARALAVSLPAVITLEGDFGNLGAECRVTASGTNVAIATGSVLLSDGTFLTIGAQQTLSVPDGSSARPVVLKALESPFAPGTVAIGAANRLTLAYTTDAAGLDATDIYGPNEYVRLVNGSTSLGTFRIQSVTATTIELAESVPGTTALAGLKHAPAGKFFPGYPNIGETTDLLSYLSPELRLETAGYNIGDNEIILATVSRSGATVTVTDARVPIRVRGVPLIRDANVAEDAAIQESKIALSAALLTAKANAPLQTSLRNNHTTENAFYVKGAPGSGGVRVLTTEDLAGIRRDNADPAMSAVTLDKTTISLALNETTTIKASPVGLVTGSAVTYTLVSADPTKVDIEGAPVVTGNETTWTLRGKAATTGSVQITVTGSATAVGESYAAASRQAFAAATVGASGAGDAITALRIVTQEGAALATPASLTASGTTGRTASIRAEATLRPAASAATLSYAWSITTGSQFVTLSATTGQSITVTGVGAGSATIQCLVTPSGSLGGTLATPRSVTQTFTVTTASTTALTEEPNFRINFVKDTNNVTALVEWGINGSTTSQSSTSDTWTFQMNAGNNLAVDIGPDELRDMAYYPTSTAQTKYLIISNTPATTTTNSTTGVATGSAFTFTVQKLSAGDNPPAANGGGGAFIQSLAESWSLQVVHTPTGAQTHNELRIPYNVRNVMLDRKASGGHRFTLTSAYSTQTKSTVRTIVWGAGDVGLPTLTIPPDFITATPGVGQVLFRWDLEQISNYDRSLFDIKTASRVGNPESNPWNTFVRQDDSTNTPRFMDQVVYGSPGTPVALKLQFTNAAGQMVQQGATDYHAIRESLVSSTNPGGTLGPFVYPFDFSTVAGDVHPWVNIGTAQNPVWVWMLTLVEGSFPTPVSLSRMEIRFFQDPVTGVTPSNATLLPGSASIKGIVYPLGDPSSAIAGDPTATSAVKTFSEYSGFFFQKDQKLTVAIERLGVRPTQGKGSLILWYTEYRAGGGTQL
jgi:hypothetical protein